MNCSNGSNDTIAVNAPAMNTTRKNSAIAAHSKEQQKRMSTSVVKDSYHTLTANIVNQIIGSVIFIVLPNILSVGDYAKTVYVSIILYYAGFTDLGTVLVYGRKAPALLAMGSSETVQSLEDSVQLLLHITTFVYSVAAMAFFFSRHGSYLNTLILGAIINLTPLFSFYLQKKTVRGGFSLFKQLTIAQSVTKIAVVGGAYIASLRGWFIGMAASIVAVLLYARDRSIYRINAHADLRIAARHIPEGIILAATMMIWGTLLMLGRMYAVLVCSDDVVAQYGIVNAGFQMISSAVIAIFLPVTVKIYSLCAGKTEELLWFVLKIQVVATSIVTAAVFFLVDYSPVLLSFLFRKYTFDAMLVQMVLFGLIALPVLVTAGSILIGKQYARIYLVILALVFALSFPFLYVARERSTSLAPAVTQCIFLIFAATALLLLSWYLFAGQRSWKQLIPIVSPIMVSCTLVIMNWTLKLIGMALHMHPFVAPAVADTAIGIVVLALLFIAYRRPAIVQSLEFRFQKVMIPSV